MIKLRNLDPSVRGIVETSLDVWPTIEPIYVDTTSSAAGTGKPGTNPANPHSTMSSAFDEVETGGIIFVRGDIREQITSPLGVHGVKVIGLHGGNSRHDNGVRWREAATAGDAPLITVREQGWEFHNILFVPQATYAAIRLRRQEDATYPDGSHAIIEGCRFHGNVVTPAGIGVEDYGGHFNVRIENNTFLGLVDGYLVSNQGISMPTYTQFLNNVLVSNTNHFRGAQTAAVIQGNRFLNLGATTYINTEYGNVGLDNMVIFNWFPDLGTDIKEDSGYLGNATDTWANYSTGTAALIVESPPGAS
ncbi:MAG: hypothetical protein NUW01_18210 [Gemmatimonadaceae bacterium]|nr:hypothetical protein [Gemmatimonadaceae bacterium]